MPQRRASRLAAALLAASLSVAAACGSDGEDDAGSTETTSNRGTAAGDGDSGAPVQGDPEGANTGAGGDGGAGGSGGAIDPGGTP